MKFVLIRKDYSLGSVFKSPAYFNCHQPKGLSLSRYVLIVFKMNQDENSKRVRFYNTLFMCGALFRCDHPHTLLTSSDSQLLLVLMFTL